MESRDESNQEPEVNSGEVLDSLGVDSNSAKASPEGEPHDNAADENLPKGFKDRLGRQEKRHKREMRQIQDQLNEVMSRQQAPAADYEARNQTVNPYGNGNAGTAMPNIDEHTYRAVAYALQQREVQEQKAREIEAKAHVQKQIQSLHSHLDNVSEKYDDFEDVVRGNDTPFSPAMRDAALMLPRTGSGSAGEVLYKLGKNRSDLERISKLHPLDQATEMVKLSHALMGGNSSNPLQQHKEMGHIKSNPVNTSSGGITERTSVGELRQRLKKASWR